jgi:hypothetical protein
MLFLENFTALDKKCPDCHQVPSISGVCGCDSAFRSQIRSQHSTQQVQQPPSQGRDAGAWYPDKRGAQVSDPLLTDLTPMRSSPQPTAFNLRRMCCRSLRGLGGAFHGIMDYLVHNRQVPFVTPREPTSSAGRWACRMRLAALPIASAGAEPNAGVGKTRWRPAQVGAASTSWGCKDTVTAAQAAAKSSVALEALEGGQISLAEAAALTEFIVMWTHARVGCQSTVVE